MNLKAEQMELMKVIPFSQRKMEEKKFRERKDKLEVAYKMLECLIGYGADFHIVITKESTSELFDFPKEYNKYQYATLTSNLNEAKNIKLKDNTMFYPIEGDEF